MGCASVTIRVSQPTAMINVGMNDVGNVGVNDVAQHPSVSTTLSVPAVVSTSKAYKDTSVSVWLVCRVGLNEEYLAVTDGLLLTMNDEYISVRRT